MRYLKILLCILFISLSQTVFGAEEETKPAQYERYDHGVIGEPGDAAGKMVLDFEENREMKPTGNIVHVEGTDQYLGKGIDEMKSRMAKLESKLSELEGRITNIEGKFKGKSR